MLTIFGKPSRTGGFCDGVSRRLHDHWRSHRWKFVGLANILAAEAQSGVHSSHKAIINIYLPGGPPHQDMWDLKPDAPSGIRGEFNPIKTNVPGIDICEHFPPWPR